jgi:capsular polysaccharide biosynthesis protein
MLVQISAWVGRQFHSFCGKPIRRYILDAISVAHKIAPTIVGDMIRVGAAIPGSPEKLDLLLDFLGEPRPWPQRGTVRLLQVPIARFAQYRITHPAREVVIEPPKIMGNHSLVHCKRRPLGPNYIATVQDCLVHMSSSVVIAGKKILQQSLDTDLRGYVDRQSTFFTTAGRGKYVLTANPKLDPSTSYERGILIGNRFAYNYFHFLIECLPRVILARAAGVEPAPFVVGEVPPSCVELLSWFGSLLQLDSFTLTHFETLHIPHLDSFSPDNPAFFARSVYDTTYLEMTRRAVLDRVPVVDRCTSDIIYLGRRGGNTRNIVNEEEVLPILQSINADIIYPGEMCIAEQVAAFQAANLIIAPAGAGVANILFCRPGARLIVLNQDKLVNPGYFSLLAQSLGVGFCSVAGRGIEDRVHSSFVIDPDTLARAIDSMIGRNSSRSFGVDGAS